MKPSDVIIALLFISSIITGFIQVELYQIPLFVFGLITLISFQLNEEQFDWKNTSTGEKLLKQLPDAEFINYKIDLETE